VDLSKTSFGTNKPQEPLTLADLKKCVDDALAKGADPALPVFVRVTDCDGDVSDDGGLTAARHLAAGTGYGRCFMLDAHSDVGEDDIEPIDVTIGRDVLDHPDEDEPEEPDDEEPGVLDVLDNPMARGYDPDDESEDEDDEED